MQPTSVLWLLVLGLVFHCAYFPSIFDIYFRSPLVHGMTPVQSTQQPTARRLVLFVADGLRADRLLEQTPIAEWESASSGSSTVDRAPYLRDIVRNRGVYGVSHTRVPTESRPGHVAIIAGFYEDVSAVTKGSPTELDMFACMHMFRGFRRVGWKMNPVNFDSVFNQSRETWSFGSPDILPMFQHGASNPARIHTVMYDAHLENFNGDASFLDTWVFDKVRDMFRNASLDAELNTRLRQDKLVFFLHLLGLDTNGHTHRPHSQQYIQNIGLVDRGVREMETLFREFYKDDKTAFVFTADHGMSNIGNHGDGNPDNTRTPLIVWGAGVHPPLPANELSRDSFSREWGLDTVGRVDVRQADIAPLMCSLVGLNYPVNSVGVLPVEYLRTSEREQALALSGNVKQILSQFLVKEKRKRTSEPFFQEFEPLNNETHSHGKLISALDRLISEGKFASAERLSFDIIDLCLEGLRYYQTYDWLFLRSVVSMGYLGWILYSLIFIVKKYVRTKLSSSDSQHTGTWANGLTLVAVFSLTVLLMLKQSPWLYYVYATFPALFWNHVFHEGRLIVEVLRDVGRRVNWWIPAGRLALATIGLELLVLSYFRREALTVWFLFFGWVWPITFPKTVWKERRFLLASWTASCTVTGLFMLLPVELHEDMFLFNAGAIAAACFGIAASFHPANVGVKQSDKHRWRLFLQSALVVVSLFLVNSTTNAFRAGRPLPLPNQITSWIVFVVALVLPFARSQGGHYFERLSSLCLSFAAPLVLLSITYETLFFVSFSVNLLTWLELERALYLDRQLSPTELLTEMPHVLPSPSRRRNVATLPRVYRSLCADDIRIAILFLFYINVAFFGTGNVASVASFQLSSIYRLTTVFDPFLMGGLIVLKMLIPFLLLSAVFGVLSKSLDLPPFSLFLFTVCSTDVMTLNFFFLVRDSGSWLDIGSSISHFVIASAFEILSVVLFGLSWLLVHGVTVAGHQSMDKVRRAFLKDSKRL